MNVLNLAPKVLKVSIKKREQLPHLREILSNFNSALNPHFEVNK